MKRTIKLPNKITPTWLVSGPRKELRLVSPVARVLGITEGAIRARVSRSADFKPEEENMIRLFLAKIIEE